MLLLLLHTPAIAQQMPFPQKAYTLEGVRLRSTPSTSGEILQVVPGFTDVKIREQLQMEKVGTNTDHWYKVQVNDATGKTGYIFGHFLSLRQAGRKTLTLKYTSVEVGDFYHFIFTNVATGEQVEYGMNYLDDNINLLDESETEMNPKYANKLFKAVVNKLPGLVPTGPEEMGPGEVELLIELVLKK